MTFSLIAITGFNSDLSPNPFFEQKVAEQSRMKTKCDIIVYEKFLGV
jgi:hypothetical protein